MSNTNKNKKTNLFLTFPACLDIYSRPRSETGVTAVATGPPRRGASSLPKEVPVQSPIPAREGKQSRGAGLSPDASPASRCVCSQWLSLASLASLTSSREGVTDRPRPGGPVTPCLQTRVTAMRRRAGRGTSSANEENPERTCCIPFARLFAFAVVCEALEKT